MYRAKIWAPVVTGVVPDDAHMDMMLLPDGEIRHYGSSLHDESLGPEDMLPIVMKSRDGGLNWITEPITEPHPGAMTQIPWSKRWIVLHNYGGRHDGHFSLRNTFLASYAEPGVYCTQAESPEGPFATQKILGQNLHIQRQVLPLSGIKRLIAGFEYRDNNNIVSWGVLYSDDDGKTWNQVDCIAPELPAAPLPGHGGARWIHCGIEPVICEYPDGTLHALLRCAHDQHYESISRDFGLTWSKPEPSLFFACATMPGLYRLSGDRILAIWNNTVPLPEVDHRSQVGGNTDDLIKGFWEDAFTNRDALHAAISSDCGKTWRGFREVLLNPARNDADFRSKMFGFEHFDKSVHQNQAVELPNGKILLAAGQNIYCRRFVLFDPAWLDEKSRCEDFCHGTRHISNHLYYKGIAGGFRGITGHCAYNRRPGAVLMPHPDRLDREVMLIGRHPDPRLISDSEGIVWNFPAAFSGTVRIRFRQVQGSEGTRFILTDRWINPSDPIAVEYASISVEVDRLGIFEHKSEATLNCWHTLTLRWNCEKTDATFQIDDGSILPAAFLRPTKTGISYLHIQTTSAGADPFGIMLESMEMNMENEI